MASSCRSIAPYHLHAGQHLRERTERYLDIGTDQGPPNRTVVLHWTGQAPIQTFAPVVPDALGRVVVTGPEDIWLLPTSGTARYVYHGDGKGAFTQVETGANLPILDLAASGTGDLWATGGKGMLLRRKPQ